LRSLFRSASVRTRTAVASSCGAVRAACRQPVRRKLSTMVAEEAKPSLLVEGQVDSGMWQGLAILAGVTSAVTLSSEEQRTSLVRSILNCYRACGLKESLISDRRLIEDHVRKNAVAAVNVLMASPVFYFAFSKIYGTSFVVSSIRSITGSLRIVPFMGFFYGFFAVVCPFVTQYFMETGQSYEEASTTAAIAVMLSGFVFIEALVELRGCGVTFAQMTASSFVLFIPALVGRLATGVLTQQQKVGSEEKPPILPASWEHSDQIWQAHTYRLFERLHLDNEFVVTCAGTSVFQHVLNSITWVLLTQGKATTLMGIAKFMLGGPNGTVLSGASQFGRTFIMRFGFSWVWNWCSSQEVNMPVFDPFLKDAK